MESKKINQLATELTPALSDLTIIGDPTTGISKKITLSQMASLFTGTVEEYANLASFPLVGAADTIYIALDTNVLYRWDTGLTSYVELSPNIINSLVFNDANGFDGTISLVGSVATLTITTALTTGSVGFIGASGALLQDNANFFWDDTNNRLGIGTNAPTTAIDTFGSGIITRVNGTSTNNAFIGFASAGTNKWSVGNVQSDHRFRIYSEANTSELVSVLQTGEFGIGIANPTTKLHIDGGASALIANLDANVSVAKSISFRSDNSNRINIEVSGTESGSNAGANFFLRTYTDAGALLATPLTITRSTGAISLATALSGTTASFTGLIRTDLGAAGTSGTFTGTGSNFQINHDGSSAISLINSGGGGYIFKAGNLTTTIFSLSDAGAGNFLSNLSVNNATNTEALNVSGTMFLQTTADNSIGGKIYGYNDTSSNLYSGGLKFQTRYYNGTSYVYRDVATINSSGNLGLGTTTPTDKLHIVGGGLNTQTMILESTLSVANAYIGFKNTSKQYTIGLTVDIGTNNFIVYDNTAAATRFLISSTGNIGIGTTTPGVLVDINSVSNADATIRAKATGTGAAFFVTDTKIASYVGNQYQYNGTTYWYTGAINGDITNFFAFYSGASATERMRILSTGQICINQNSASAGNYNLNVSGNGGIWVKASNSGDAAYVSNGGTGFHFYGMTASNVNTFHVLNNGDVRNTNNSYGALSDIKLKENIQDASPKLQDLLKVKIRNYNLISDDLKIKQLGVIAQELEEIFPNMISEYKEMGSDETIKTVKYSVFVPMLIKAIQELNAKIDSK